MFSTILLEVPSYQDGVVVTLGKGCDVEEGAGAWELKKTVSFSDCVAVTPSKCLSYGIYIAKDLFPTVMLVYLTKVTCRQAYGVTGRAVTVSVASSDMKPVDHPTSQVRNLTGGV